MTQSLTSDSRGAAETTSELSDDDPYGVFFIVNKKTHKKVGGCLCSISLDYIM